MNTQDISKANVLIQERLQITNTIENLERGINIASACVGYSTKPSYSRYGSYHGPTTITVSKDRVLNVLYQEKADIEQELTKLGVEL